jgi:hypothetical protein
MQAAEYLAGELKVMGLTPAIEAFPMWSYGEAQAKLTVLEPYQQEVECMAVGLSGNTPAPGVEADLEFVQDAKPDFMGNIKGKILLTYGWRGLKSHRQAKEDEVQGVVRINEPGKDYMHLSLSHNFFERFGKLPSVWISFQDAVDLIQKGARRVRLFVNTEEIRAESHNVVVEIPGTEKSDECVVFVAHYDSVPATEGASDNGGGSVTQLEICRYFAAHRPRRTLRFVWCGSEEFGLLGSYAYVDAHQNELEQVKLVINSDVMGGTIGRNAAVVLGGDDIKGAVENLGKELGAGLEVRPDIMSSDCIPFADKGIPSVNFARYGGATFYLHTPGDALRYCDAKSLELLGEAVLTFADRVANAVVFPFERSIPDGLQKKVHEYITDHSGLERPEKKA